jgi:Inorganic Pyrophosphatase
MIKWNGLIINVSHPEGSVREGTNKEGNRWSQRMPFSYGRIKDTKGVDGLPVDVILSDDHKPSDSVFVVTLPKSKQGEDKVLIGFDSIKIAKSAFLSCYGGDASFIKRIYPLTVRALKKKLKSRRGLNLSANYNTAPFGMNNYLVEYSPIKESLGPDTIEKYEDDSPADHAYNRSLLQRQGKPEVVEVTLGVNTNDNLDFLITGSKEK